MDADDGGNCREHVGVYVQAGETESDGGDGDPLDSVDAVEGAGAGRIFCDFGEGAGPAHEAKGGEHESGESGSDGDNQINVQDLPDVKREREPEGSEAGEEEGAD